MPTYEQTYERYKAFKYFTVGVFGYNNKRPDKVIIEDIDYYISCDKRPKAAAKELRRIADWLDTL